MAKVQAFKPYVAQAESTRVAPQMYSHTKEKGLNSFGKIVANVVAHAKACGTEQRLNTTFTASDFARNKAKEEVKVTQNMVNYGLFAK